MKKIAQLFIVIISIFSLTGCKVERKGSVTKAFSKLNDITSITLKANIKATSADERIEDTSIDMIFKTKDSDIYTEIVNGDYTEKIYSINKDNETCTIEYYDSTKIAAPGWYGRCDTTNNNDSFDIDFSIVDILKDEDFIYEDGWYVLKPETFNLLVKSMETLKLGKFEDFFPFEGILQGQLKIQLADGKLETIQMSYITDYLGTELEYTQTIKLLKINDTKVKAPKYTIID